MVNCIVRCGDAATGNYRNYFFQAPKVMTPDANSKNTRSCSRLYRAGFLTLSSRPLGSTRWREVTKRRPVLAPLLLKQNSDIVFSEKRMNKKRKLSDSVEYIPTKRMKLLKSDKDEDALAERKMSIRTLSLKFKCMVNRPMVKLFDVFREIPIVPEVVKPVPKNEFMGLLGLGDVQPKPVSTSKITNPVSLTTCTWIPFSSNCGRLILQKRHGLSEEIALKKLDKTEWYLSNQEVVKKDCDFEVTPPKDCEHVRTYCFPKRQFSQNHQSLAQGFMRYVCKPVCVKIERTDFSAKTNKINNNSNEIVKKEQVESHNIENKMKISVNCAIIKRSYLDDKGSDTNSDDSNLISPIVYANNTDMFRQTDEFDKLKLRLSDSRTPIINTPIFNFSNPKTKVTETSIFRRSPRLKRSL